MDVGMPKEISDALAPLAEKYPREMQSPSMIRIAEQIHLLQRKYRLLEAELHLPKPREPQIIPLAEEEPSESEAKFRRYSR